MTQPGMLIPLPDDDSQPFWEAAARGELRIQHCAQCHEPRFPPRPMCPHCRSTSVDWRVMSGLGTIWSFVVPHPPLLESYAAVAPYNVIVVSLAEAAHIRLVGNLVSEPNGSIGEVDPAVIAIGQQVRVVFSDPVDGIAMPRWVPVD